MKGLFEMTVWESKPTIYKELRPQEILNSEENVQRVTEQNVIENEYLNPFGLMDEREKRKLFHLSCSVP